MYCMGLLLIEKEINLMQETFPQHFIGFELLNCTIQND